MLINYLLTATIALPLLVGALNYKSLSAPARLFFLLIAIGAINEVVMIILAGLHTNNLFTLHFYSIVELAVYTAFYRLLIREPKVKIILWPIMVMIVLIAVGFALIGDNIYTFNSIPRALEAVFIICMIGYYFYELTVYNDGKELFTNGYFVLTGAIFFYFSSCFIIFLFPNNVTTPNLFAMYGAHAHINAFCNIIFAIGLWMISRLYSMAR